MKPLTDNPRIKRILMFFMLLLVINLPIITAQDLAEITAEEGELDITPPALVVGVQEVIAGDKLDITGWTEVGAEVELLVNGIVMDRTIALEENKTEEFSGVAEVIEEVVEEQIIEEDITETSSENNTNETALAGQAFSDNFNTEDLPPGVFHFYEIELEKNYNNNITVQAEDAAGNIASWNGNTFSDAKVPQIQIGTLPELVDADSIELMANLSEICSWEIFINNRSQAQGEGAEIKEEVSLEEGKNIILIQVKDAAGWEKSAQVEIESDSMPPIVNFVIEKGNEYYQGRAVSDINGETEPEATLYLYVYKPLGYEYNPQFDKAWAKVTADSNGSFNFNDVNFESTPLNWEDLAPEQVPQGLLEYSLFPVEVIEEQQQFTYYVFVVAEDKSGKTGYQQETITVNSCYVGDWAFDIESLPEFQKPLRINPELLDSGREAVSAVFNMTYRGEGQAKRDLVTGLVLVDGEAFEVSDFSIERACTQSMMDDPAFEIACKVFPPSGSIKLLPNSDKTSWYATLNLMPSEELSSDKDFSWDSFKKRKLVFPLKLRVSYQERDAQGLLGPTKTQTMCYDVGYLVDMTIDSKDMLPDWLVDEGVKGLEETIKAIDTVIPYIEKAIIVTGIGCIGSFISRLIVRYVRIVTSKLETYFTLSLDPEKRCPSNQQSLLMQSTIKHWTELKSSGYFVNELAQSDPELKYGKDWDQKSLDKVCPNTANMWEVESYLDQAYRWTCDRVFCRAAPARWTASKEKSDVDTVILSQKQCAASSKGIPLILREDCQKIVFGQSTQQTINPDLNDLRTIGAFSCYQNTLNGQYYYITPSEIADINQAKPVKLKWLAPVSLNFQDVFTPGGKSIYGTLIAYKPTNSKDVLVGVDQTCESVCRNIVGYRADKGNVPSVAGGSSSVGSTAMVDSNGGGIKNYYIKPDGTTDGTEDYHGCYREVIGGNDKIYWADRKDDEMRGARFAAGYTQDCFVEVDKTGEPLGAVGAKTGLLQCVCTLNEEVKTSVSGVRQAGKETTIGSENWIYREAMLNKDNPAWGTYYPQWRYYSGRDLPAAFGANSLTDYLRQNETIHEVNPLTQHIGAFQALCLSGIRARLMALRSILQALKTCFEEAKYTGLKDAGVCKTLFTQQVCGLMYQAIAYFASDCSPLSAQDQDKKGGTLDDVGAVTKATLGSITEAMDSSIDDIKSDYTNSNLEQTFSGGAKGFAQSLCLAAFGYDWPLGVNFILDSAYAVPMATNPLVIPARRELATYNPQTGTAVFDYTIGALVLPGCKIRSVDVSLRCIGKEELKYEGVDCAEQGCDCLNIQEQSAIVDSDRTYPLDGGRKFDLAPGSLIDLEIPSPQKVDKHYRYDHVLVHIALDSYESAESCFDEGYRDGNFYFPITDVTPEEEFNCRIMTGTGKYYCPELLAMFGGGAGAYLQDPFISCYDKTTQTFTSCETPNLFVKNDPIKVKVHLMSDGGKYCLKTSVTGLDAYTKQDIQQLAANIPGELSQIINIGTVRSEVFTGQSTFSLAPSSAQNCNGNIQILTSGVTAPAQSYYFKYTSGTVAGTYIIEVPNGVLVNAPYTIDNNHHLILNNQIELTPVQITPAEFDFSGYKVKGLIGNPNPAVQAPLNVCIYAGSSSGSSLYSSPLYSSTYGTGTTAYSVPVRSISVTAEVLLPDQNGGCYNAITRVRQPTFGKNSFTQTITLQLESLASTLASEIHREFTAGNYQSVVQKAATILERKQADIEDVSALYYSVSSYLVQAGSISQAAASPLVLASVCNNLDLFFKRYSSSLNQCLTPYPQALKQSSEYHKAYQYMSIYKSSLSCPIANVTCPT